MRLTSCTKSRKEVAKLITMKNFRCKRFLGCSFISAAFIALHTTLAWAQQAEEMSLQPQTLGEVLPRMLPIFVAVFFIFYFLVLRPQQTRLKEQQSLHQSLKKGDTVATSGGIIGKVYSISEGEVQLEVSNGVRVKFEREHIVKQVDNKASAKSAA
jgi:preprotein translocase subunit YajC